MQAFDLLTAVDRADALRLRGGNDDAAYIAGGTTLIDLMKCGVVEPATLIDITRLPLAGIEADERRIRIGALARNSDIAYHPAVADQLPMLAQAFLAGASPQLRNMATLGGNLLQRTRCGYFRDPASACNKRDPGSGCDALVGPHRMHAVLGTSEACIATHASDAAVALVALDAVVEIDGAGGLRHVALEEFYREPGETPWVENVLGPGELIVTVEIAVAPAQRGSCYVKVRDRASYEFALVSAAAGLEIEGGRIVSARLALGGVATRPWRARAAESELLGKAASDEAFGRAAEAALSGAVPRRDNAFKVELAKRAIVRSLQTARAS